MAIEQPKKVRVRVAPSPTGLFHTGTARSALFDYLFAKKNNGTFVLRIEDTDVERSKPEYTEDILEGLKWLGLDYAEMYFQSKRLDIYEKYLQKLLDENKAYYCFCAKEELEAQRRDQMSRGVALKYPGECANLDPGEVEKKLKEEQSAVIRFKVESRKVKFKDLVRGEVEFDMGLTGDIVIAKNLRHPLFIFAGTVDDFEMQISHVIRGEDHISNTPKQILLQEALGFPQPEYAHLPLILAPDRSKLSKRHGAKPISEYRKEGYLAEAIINFIAFLGWNPGGQKEIYSLEELAKDFSLERVQKAGAVFNIQRLDYLNGYYIRQLDLGKLTELCLAYLPSDAKEKFSFEELEKIVLLYKERLKKLSEIRELTDFFFKEKLEYDKALLVWKDMQISEIKKTLELVKKILVGLKEGEWTKQKLEAVLMPEAEMMKDRGKLLWPFRSALTGKKASAGPFEVAEALGKEKTIKRIEEAIKML